MPQIDLSFTGYLRGVTIERAVDVDGKVVDVRSWPAQKLCKALEDSELFISLGTHLYEGSNKSSINLSDFQPAL